MKKILLLVLTLTAFPVMSMANTLSPNFVINKMIKDRGVLKNIEIEGTVTDLRNHLSFKDLTRVDFIQGKVYTQITGAAGEVLAESVTRVSQLHPMGLAWYGVGMCSNPAHVKEYIDHLKINFPETAQVKLKRIYSHVVWEMGDVATLLIEKDQFLLAGYEESHESGYEAESFSSVGPNTRIPKMMHFRKGAVEQYSFELKNTRVNQKTLSMTATSKTQPQAFVKEWIDLVH